MIYAPHFLQREVVTKLEEDEFGRPIPNSGGASWENVCRCRCDDISAEKRVSVNGSLYDFKYKVVYEFAEPISAGTKVRCLDKDGNVRGEGIAKNPTQANYFLCKVIWLE